MAVSAARVTVSTSAVALNSATGGGSRLIVRNTDATNGVDIGASNVTAGTGYRLLAGQTLTLELLGGEQFYAIRSAAADVVCDVLRSSG